MNNIVKCESRIGRRKAEWNHKHLPGGAARPFFFESKKFASSTKKMLKIFGFI